MAILLQAASISYAHGGNDLFHNLSLTIQERDRIALIGENGSGKSTLFRLLVGELRPQAGDVTSVRGLRIGYLRQESDLPADHTVREVLSRSEGTADALEWELLELEDRLAQDLSDDEMAATLDRYNDVLTRLDTLPPDTGDSADQIAAVLGDLRFPEHRLDQQVRTLSGGERKLVDVARFLIDQPDLLLLDEPDNHFDIDARSWLENWLTSSFTGAVAMISHDRFMIDRIARDIVELEDGKLRRYHGNYSDYLQQKRARIERELELRAVQEREFQKLKVASEELTQWARQNDKFAPRAENMRRRVAEEREKLESTPVPKLDRATINVGFATERGSTNVVQGTNVSIRYGERTVVKPFDVLIRHGERVGIIGPNGAGKTSLVRLLTRELAPTTGEMRIGANISMAFYDQLHGTLSMDAVPLELVRKARPLNENQAVSALIAMGFDRHDALNTVGNLSGGERARLQIALMQLSGANLLVLDEPTNNLDLASVEKLEAGLQDYAGTIISISHDRQFMDRVCTRILQIDDGIVRDYPGGYSWTKANAALGTPLTRGMAHPAAKAPEPPTRKRVR